MTAQELRLRLVAELTAKGALTDERVKAAFLAVPRERFIPQVAEAEGLERVYQDAAIQTLFDSRGSSISSSSQPAIMAPMLEMLRLEPGTRVLEIGTATGYNAALLSHVVGPSGLVTSIELEPGLAGGAAQRLHDGGYAATVVAGDGRLGVPAHAPYDAIVVTASTADVYRPWFEQLRPGGRLVLPLILSPGVDGAGVFGSQAVAALERTATGFESVRVIPGAFLNLRSHASEPNKAGSVDFVGLSEARNSAIRPIAQFRGGNLGRLSEAARLRLARLVAQASHRSALGGRAPFFAYVALAAPPTRLAAYTGQEGNGLALIDAAGRSAAALVVSGRPPKLQAQLLGWGTDVAARELRQLIAEWKSNGSPGLGNLRIRVSYGGRSTGAWRTSKRDQATLSFDVVS